MVYCLFLDTEDRDSHLFTELIGIFTTLEKAKKEHDRWLEKVCDRPRMNDKYKNWNLYIITWKLDEIYGHYVEVE